jgi:hypothetical protein
MIVFDLKCTHGHVFEAWFRASADFDDQAARGMIACPLCADTGIVKAMMAPNVGSKGNRSGAAATTGDRVSLPTPDAHAPANPAALLAHILAMQADALRHSTWVGRRFAAEARAMDAGDTDVAPIHGQATPAEARALADDGIVVMPLLIPIVPPELQN